MACFGGRYCQMPSNAFEPSGLFVPADSIAAKVVSEINQHPDIGLSPVNDVTGLTFDENTLGRQVLQDLRLQGITFEPPDDGLRIVTRFDLDNPNQIYLYYGKGKGRVLRSPIPWGEGSE